MSKQNLDRLNFLILGGMDFDWSAHLAEQLSWHWEAQLRPRLAGLTDVLASIRGPAHGVLAIERLVSKFDETVALAVWGNLGPTITHWEPASAPVSDALPVGLTLPVASTATGLAFAAHLPAADVAEAIRSDQTASQGEERDWGRRLEDVRQRGLARRGLEAFYRSDIMINAISAPVLDASGRAVLALTAVGEANRFRADLDGDFACARFWLPF